MKTLKQEIEKNKFNPDDIDKYMSGIEQYYCIPESQLYMLFGKIAEKAMRATDPSLTQHPE